MWKNMLVPDRPKMKYCMAHAHCLLDTKGYKQTIRICHTYSFTTATVVARTRLDVTLLSKLPSCLDRLVRSAEKTGFKSLSLLPAS
jgi:hypothetical protein